MSTITDEERIRYIRKEIHKAAHGDPVAKKRIKHPNVAFWIWDWKNPPKGGKR